MAMYQADDFPDDYVIAHYGIKMRSGRYPYGSGEDPHQHNRTLLSSIESMKKQGLTETQIATGLGFKSTTEFRNARSVAKNAEKQDAIKLALKLREEDGLSNGEIAAKLRESGYKVASESGVRAMLETSVQSRVQVLDTVSTLLRDRVDKHGLVDVGVGVEHHLGISNDKLKKAVSKLEKEEGYAVRHLKVEQLGTGKQTNMKVLAKPGTTWSEAQRNRHTIHQVRDVYSEDGGRSLLNVQAPMSISSKRVGIRYKEDGGATADGVVYVRRGVKDVSLDGAQYAQVRIAVDKTHYIKGMAVYKDDMPPGVDLLFNTNKSDTGNKLDALKKMKTVKKDGQDTGEVDWDNPFGASISRQIGDVHKGGQKKLTSVMNIVNEEGDWGQWSKNLSSQMLSKQPPKLAKEQLDLAYERRKNELDVIRSIDNPSVKKKLLEAFADGSDSAAVHLKAAAMPRQATQVILPVNSLKDGEIYAPNFKHGERVMLVRFPHGSVSEIPELVVNNKHPEGRKLIGAGRAKLDAVGINAKVAERLSGADFDGDTVLVIPNNGRRVKNAPPLEKLKNFDPKAEYPKYPGMKVMSEGMKGTQMGLVSNLITDMTIQNASQDEIARAIRHSMTVIDAVKHELDYQRSARENGIAALKKKYQSNSENGGAATLISRARSRMDVREKKLRSAAKGGPIDRVTGKLVYEETGKSWVDAKGKTHFKTQRSVKLAETDDAHSLSSGTLVEKVYADHSNRLKGLANEARLLLVNTRSQAYNPTAKKTYAQEVASLDAKLTLAERNAPLERQAQILANHTVALRKQANPDMDKDELKKIKSQALVAARLKTGAEKHPITITDREWVAIQAGAITGTKLDKILTNADLDKVKELATPREKKVMDSAKMARARAMIANDHTLPEIAELLGVSLSTLKDNLGSE